jgi:hypothetical protein
MEMKMRFTTLFDHGPNRQRGNHVSEQGTPIEGHLESMRRRFDEGALLDARTRAYRHSYTYVWRLT